VSERQFGSMNHSLSHGSKIQNPGVDDLLLYGYCVTVASILIVAYLLKLEMLSFNQRKSNTMDFNTTREKKSKTVSLSCIS
jgi:hypothetical protein